jgi:hypothetical protein
MLSKLCLGLSLAAVAFADEPVGTVIGIDLGTTYSVSPPAQLLRPPTGFTAGCLLAPGHTSLRSSAHLPPPPTRARAPLRHGSARSPVLTLCVRASCSASACT